MFVETRYRLEIFNTYGVPIKSKRRYRVSALQVALQNQNPLIVDPFQKKIEKETKNRRAVRDDRLGTGVSASSVPTFCAIAVNRKL